MKKSRIVLWLGFLGLLLVVIIYGCGQLTSSTSSDNGVPFPSEDVVFQLDELSEATASSSLKAQAASTRAEGLVGSAYAQAGIDLGYFEGFDPVLTTFRTETLTTLSSNESTFEGTYSTDDIAFKGKVITSESNYIVKIWGIRPGQSDYRRWVYGDFINANQGMFIIDPYIMWTSTHDYPMTIKFSYDAATTGTKVCTGGATGKWSASSEIIGSTYFYCKEDDSDTSNTIVTFKMYSNATNESTGVSILDKLYGKFNRDENRLHGRDWTNGYAESDSGLLYVNTETFATVEGTVPDNVDASSMSFPATPESDFAAWPAISEFPVTPDF
ncbi:hypothetical protein ACFL5U_02625 [Candidatus Margulisiibacteriota bacterium]